ncbi:hypothetical protein HMP0721_2361 [Pseudoramibacter alactolyticus ATCC 23263]|uniref:Uncharacterized protein n=1 Tax=Pseudoramibacter alactolyticus ATCC 23263 TaxID=887929 RepID=E6MK25_9FIRM|nr:hypothetical protein HMP0721_2361 [Pseudoramibacter alactolyticus ATCC 23263]
MTLSRPLTKIDAFCINNLTLKNNKIITAIRQQKDKKMPTKDKNTLRIDESKHEKAVCPQKSMAPVLNDRT